MSSKWTSLPVEFWGIMSDFLFAHELCWLWLSGSKQLQYRLEMGVTRFHHLPAPGRRYQWPALISRFLNLKTAEIESLLPLLKVHLYQDVKIQDIPKSITSLKLVYANGFFGLLQPPPTGHIWANLLLPLHDISDLFPKLAHLEVNSAIALHKSQTTPEFWAPLLSLPLTTLNLTGTIYLTAKHLKLMSPTITTLALSVKDKSQLSFSSHLVDLSIRLSVDLDLSILPQSLKKLNLSCKKEYNIQLGTWPRQLENLRIEHMGLSLAQADIKALPTTLNKLQLIVKQLEVRALQVLPPKLKILWINWPWVYSRATAQDWAQFDPKSLPRGLGPESIFVPWDKIPIESLASFPPAVSGFHIELGSDPVLSLSAAAVADRFKTASLKGPAIPHPWAFKNLVELRCVAEPVHLYFILPQLPLVEILFLRGYMDDPSAALNRIVSPHLTKVTVNCHPLSLCKWSSPVLQKIQSLEMSCFQTKGGKFVWKEFLAGQSGLNIDLDETQMSEITGMMSSKWKEPEKSVAYVKESKRADEPHTMFINWMRFARFLPRGLTSFDISHCEYIKEKKSGAHHLRCEWPLELRELNAPIPTELWSTLPARLSMFCTNLKKLKSSKLAKFLPLLPKSLANIFVSIASPVDGLDTIDYSQLFEERPNLTDLYLNNISRTPFSPPTREEAIATTFGHSPHDPKSQ